MEIRLFGGCRDGSAAFHQPTQPLGPRTGAFLAAGTVVAGHDGPRVQVHHPQPVADGSQGASCDGAGVRG